MPHALRVKTLQPDDLKMIIDAGWTPNGSPPALGTNCERCTFIAAGYKAREVLGKDSGKGKFPHKNSQNRKYKYC